MLMKVKFDLTGVRIGAWTVAGLALTPASRKTMWRCKCDCGTERALDGSNLRNGRTQSCGCQKKALVSKAISRHGISRTRVHRSWVEMRKRCLNPAGKFWLRYGGRGIGICSRWDVFENFLADMGQPPEGTSLDRIDNDKGYSKENCRWATPTEQTNNCSSNVRLEHDGRTLTLAQWSRELGIRRTTISERLSRGYSVHEALTKPVAPWRLLK